MSTPSTGRPSAPATERAFPARVLADERDGVGVLAIVLLVLRRDRVERDAELLEDRPPLRRGRCERAFAGGALVARSRAFQISSDGQQRAHSAVTKS